MSVHLATHYTRHAVQHARSKWPRKGQPPDSLQHATHNMHRATCAMQHGRCNRPRRESHRLHICDRATLHRHYAVGNKHHTTSLHAADAHHRTGKPIARLHLRPDRPSLPRVHVQWYWRSPQTRTSRCHRTCLAHLRVCSAYERGAPSLSQDDRSPTARCNVPRSLCNTAEATEATCNMQRHAHRMLTWRMQPALRSIQRATHNAQARSVQRKTCVRAASQCNTDYPTGRTDWCRTTCNMQHATFNTKMQHGRTPCNMKHACTLRSTSCHMYHTRCNVQRTPCNSMQHAQWSSRIRTTEERAMLPPLNSTDPPFIATTPPLCTPPPHSASGPIAPPPPLPSHTYRCFSIGYRHILERRAASKHAQHTTTFALQKSAAQRCSVKTTVYPHARCNVKRSLHNKEYATEATCNGTHGRRLHATACRMT
jgi:hypothetical protein